jgi:hypothetical protein
MRSGYAFSLDTVDTQDHCGVMDEKPLADASKHLRRLARQQQRIAAAPPVSAPRPDALALIAAVGESRDKRAKIIARIQQQLDRITGLAAERVLVRLEAALSLFERGLAKDGLLPN